MVGRSARGATTTVLSCDRPSRLRGVVAEPLERFGGLESWT
jgi:hypothetical protein